MINLTHGAFQGVFKNWGLILISRKSPVFACNQLINRFNRHFRSSKRFKEMRINPHFLKTNFSSQWTKSLHTILNPHPQSSILNFWKVTKVWKKCLPSAPKINFGSQNYFFLLPDIWAKCFLQKNCTQFGQIWPPQSHLLFTSAYRGSPPCTIFHHPGNREI